MKVFIYSLLFLLLMGCGKKVQQTTREEEKPDVPLAEIEFPEGTNYNFGNYYERVVKTHDFLVHNPGKVPLIISKVETVCPCTQATYPEKPILEGQTDTIHVAFDGNGFVEGHWYKSIRIFANIAGDTRDLQIHGAYFDANK
jgi:hypothetical protein